jgi:hypothetical protein
MENGEKKGLENLTIIEFPHTIISDEASNLLNYISERLNCRVEYDEERFHRIEDGRESRETKLINGEITRIQPRLTMLPFSFVREIIGDYSRFSGIMLSPLQGYEAERKDPDEIEFMRNVKKTVGDYFSSINTSKDSQAESFKEPSERSKPCLGNQSLRK